MLYGIMRLERIVHGDGMVNTNNKIKIKFRREVAGKFAIPVR